MSIGSSDGTAASTVSAKNWDCFTESADELLARPERDAFTGLFT